MNYTGFKSNYCMPSTYLSVGSLVRLSARPVCEPEHLSALSSLPVSLSDSFTDNLTNAVTLIHLQAA